MKKEKTITIGEAAREAGVGVETIRFYERKNLLGTPVKDASGYRRFDQSDLNRIRFIRRAKKLGFSLSEIRELLDLRIGPGRTCEEVRQKATAKMLDIEELIRSLVKINSALHKLASLCTGEGPAGECPFLDALEHDQQPLHQGPEVNQ
ncbi:MAG: MerR family transcriptional regulator [Spirochaetales bacterium]|nr:MerR family transcriptional regulator [Spirochaetales bacterium]